MSGMKPVTAAESARMDAAGRALWAEAKAVVDANPHYRDAEGLTRVAATAGLALQMVGAGLIDAHGEEPYGRCMAAAMGRSLGNMVAQLSPAAQAQMMDLFSRELNTGVADILELFDAKGTA